MPRYVVLFCFFFAVLFVLGWMGMPLYWFIMATLAIVLVLLWASLRIDSNFFLKTLYKSDNKKSVTLSFDDGPLEGNTERILDILKSQNIKASFFFIGNRMEKNPQLVKQTFEEGHVIGGHSYWHRWNFGFQLSKKVEKEISETAALLKSIVGVTPRFFRPPFGVTNPSIARAVREQKVVTIGWSLRSLDTVIKSKEKLMARVKRVKPGDIILFHDYCENTIEILPQFITMVKNRGIEFETLEDFLNEKAYE